MISYELMASSMRAIIDMVRITEQLPEEKIGDALATWWAVHGVQQVPVRVRLDGRVPISELSRLVGSYTAGGCQSVRLLLAYMEQRFGVPASELLDDFERDLVDGQ